MPTHLGERISDGVKEAHSRYERMTGWWLQHAPEHFLQNEVARSIWEKGNGNDVYIDASNTKVRADAEAKTKRGWPKKDSGKRFDISVWHRSKNTLKAVIEIKHGERTLFTRVKKDAKRIEDAAKCPNAASVGYILVYSVKKNKEGIETDFRTWKKELGSKWTLASHFVTKPHNEDWAWGFALLRFN